MTPSLVDAQDAGLPNTWPHHTADSDRGSVNLRTAEAAFRGHVDAGAPVWSVA
jgi:hypothetical protein